MHEAHTERPPITRLWGDEVPIATFDVGSPLHGEYRVLRPGPDPLVRGAIGHQPVTIRVATATDRGARALVVALGTARYHLVGAGVLPRVALHRDDLSTVATYTVLGRRPHRIADDASPEEVVLTAFLARFAARLAFRR